MPVVSKVTVSPFTNPSIEPSAVSGSPSYALVALGVVTIKVAGFILMLPSTYLIFSLDVTSSPFAFLITRVSQFAVTVPSATWVAVSSDVAVSSVYPLGRVLTDTVAPWASPLYVNSPPVVVTTISPAYSVTVNVPIDSFTV